MSKNWNPKQHVPEAPPRFPDAILAMSIEELREEWRRNELTLQQYERAFDDLIDAVWSGEDDCNDRTERPTDFYSRDDRTLATNTPELVAGIKSLYEYAGRLAVENTRLAEERNRLRELVESGVRRG